VLTKNVGLKIGKPVPFESIDSENYPEDNIEYKNTDDENEEEKEKPKCENMDQNKDNIRQFRG
jgi:hypothetical protein